MGLGFGSQLGEWSHLKLVTPGEKRCREEAGAERFLWKPHVADVKIQRPLLLWGRRPVFDLDERQEQGSRTKRSCPSKRSLKDLKVSLEDAGSVGSIYRSLDLPKTPLQGPPLELWLLGGCQLLRGSSSPRLSGCTGSWFS